MSLGLLKEDFFRIIGVLAWEQVAILVIYYKLLLVTEFVIDGVWSPSPSGHSGYVGERTELSGIFVKSIAERSAAGVDGRIDINDQIISVDGQSLQGFSNHQVTIIFRSDNKNFILSKTSNW